MKIRIEIDRSNQKMTTVSKITKKTKDLRSVSPKIHKGDSNERLLTTSQSKSSTIKNDLLPQQIGSNSRSKSKAKCPHKAARQRQKQCILEYYNSPSKTKSTVRDPTQILKENEKLRKENKVLNDYFTYLHSEHALRPNGEKQKLYTFKQIEDAQMENHHSECMAFKSRSTNTHSKLRQFK